MNAKKNAHNAVQMVEVQDHRFAVEEINGKICFNLSQMAKPFGKSKRPSNWLRSDDSMAYLNVITKSQKCDLVDLVQIRHGGRIGEAGTWTTDYRIAVRFAQWLDAEFSLAVDELIYKLLTKQAAVMEPKYGIYPTFIEGAWLYPYTEAVKAVGGPAKASASRRKLRFPQHFKKAYGRNFITGQLFDTMKSYYTYKNAQLTLNFPT